MQRFNAMQFAGRRGRKRNPVVLVYRRAWWKQNRFRSVQIGEDNQFVAVASAAGGLVRTAFRSI